MPPSKGKEGDPLLSRYILTTLLSFCALGSSLLAAALALWNLVRRRAPLFSALYLGVSLAAAAVLIRGLFRLHTGIACLMPRGQTLVYYGGLLLLQLFFAYDSYRAAGRDSTPPAPKDKTE